ncbi:chromo domain protein LHP1-like [Abrus precatorius]|uniref:Chromo domain protein LHP1-like n=1 Tax=Abrus precatorius TaxID=3816 RepID=A0A8B8JY55_ABRPR|nr:chromo domain protein LHP1-like [Abrus precatorius]
MKGGGKRKATSETPNDASVSSDAVGLGGEGGGSQVVNFEENEGTQLPKEGAEEPHAEDSEGEGADEGEEGEEEEDEEEEEEEDGEEENGGGDGDAPAAVPQEGGQGLILGDGFYEVEAIRRKRVRKGQLQYFIKWRGWPETANTWEPPENLESVPDVVEAFEESLRSGKHRRRRRKHVVHHTQPKKRLERSTTPYSLRRFSTSTAENHTQPAPLNDLSISDIPAFPQTVIFADEVETNGDAGNLGQAKHANDNRSANASEQNVERNEENDYDPKLSELRATTTNGYDTDKLAIQFQEARISSGNIRQVDGQSKGVSEEPPQSGRCRGAKRRKSGSVKRFKKDSYTGEEPVNAQRPIGMPVGTAEPAGTGIADNGGNNSRYKTDHARPASNIVKIIRPVGYSASVSSGTQDVLVTFVAMRSDGTEVMVDNKYLKAYNPILLINFYEQHLRYSPTS